MNKLLSFFVLLGSGVISIYFIQLYQYDNSLTIISKDWYENEYVQKEINGRIKQINHFEDQPFKVTITIENEGDHYDLTYGVTCVSELFNTFAKVGDFVYKMKGNQVMKLCKANQECIFWEIDFCGKFE